MLTPCFFVLYASGSPTVSASSLVSRIAGLSRLVESCSSHSGRESAGMSSCFESVAARNWWSPSEHRERAATTLQRVATAWLLPGGRSFVQVSSQSRLQRRTLLKDGRALKHSQLRDYVSHRKQLYDAGGKRCIRFSRARRSQVQRWVAQADDSRNYLAVMTVPTGTAARIGGYAGDALPAGRLLASVCDTLVTHPNVLNGAMLYWPIPNALYVEGYALDRFCEGFWGLEPRSRPQNRIGVVFDAAIPRRLLERHLQVCDAARATLGIQVIAYTMTGEPVAFRCGIHEDGSSYGVVESPETLIQAARTLLAPPYDCDALALVCYFPKSILDKADEMLEDYRHGIGVDPIGGAEAALSHTMTAALAVPCAHAPALDETMNSSERCNPKSAAEELGFTFLPCVLAGLAQAPRLVPAAERLRNSGRRTYWAEDIDALVAPGNALNGPAIRAMFERRKLVIAVRENLTCLNVTPFDVPVNIVEIGADGRFIRHECETCTERPWLLSVRSYAEAAGYLAAHREGILSDALTPSVPRIPQVPTRPVSFKADFARHQNDLIFERANGSPESWEQQ
jgi:hypothetical protein